MSITTPSGHTLTNYDMPAGPIPAAFPSLRVALVGCGRSKLSHPARARDLYTGSLFRAARRYVDAAMAAGQLDAWLILSARYGAVHPDQILGPYEATLNGFTRDQLQMWANRTDRQVRLDWGLGEFSQHGGRVHVEFLAGETYVKPLAAHWWGPLGVTWEHSDPLAHLQMGERIGWLTRQANELEAGR
jgi:hypothetical protein